MEKTPFLGAENELQKIYSNLGVMVPVGDLSTGKAPGFKVYEVKYNEDGEDSAVNATIQIYCNSVGGGLYALYKTSDIEELFPNGVPTNYDLDSAINDPESQDPILGKTQYAYGEIPFRKDMYTLSMQTTDVDHAPAALPYDDYTLIMSVYTCPLECMTTTVTSQFSAIAPPNWASADEVLDGNKFIGEDGQETVGTLVPEGAPTDGGAVITSAIYNEDEGETYTEFTFESLPTDMDLDNHRYLNVVMSRGYNYTGGDPENEEVIAPINQIGTINYTDTFNNQYDSSTSILHIGFCDPAFHNEATGEDDTEVDAVLYIYEDTLEYNGLKWVIPCTIVNGIV